MKQNGRQNREKRAYFLENRMLFPAILAISFWLLASLSARFLLENHLAEEEKQKAEKPLAFFGAMCHDKKGFDFDGFFLRDSYELFEKRLAVTKGARKPEITTWLMYEEEVTTVWFSEIQLEEYPGAVGRVMYQFCGGQFIKGYWKVAFPSYQEAKAYIQERMEETAVYQDKQYKKNQDRGGLVDGARWIWETGKNGEVMAGTYVDRQHTYLAFMTSERDDPDAYAEIQFGENINLEYREGREKSRYFSFEIKKDTPEPLPMVPPDISIIESFQELCEKSDTIVKASYVSRIRLDEMGKSVHVFRLEEDFVGNWKEPYLYLYEESIQVFERGESYYLFLKTVSEYLYPHTVCYLNDYYLSEKETKEENACFFELGTEEVRHISDTIRKNVKNGNYSVKNQKKPLAEICREADAVYRVALIEATIQSPFGQECIGEVSEVLKEEYPAGGKWVGDRMYHIRVPVDADLGEEFFVLKYYDEEKRRYVDYAEGHRAYRVDSPEGRYIQKQIGEESGRDDG